MPRRLPWKNYQSSATPLSKGKAKAIDKDPRPSNLASSSLTSRKRKNSETEEDDEADDVQDDEDWRMTESELVSTAKLWTKDLHQRAYDKLFNVQQKSEEGPNTLTNLLDVPVTQQTLAMLPPRIEEPKPESKDKATTKTTLRPASSAVAGKQVTTVSAREPEQSLPLSKKITSSTKIHQTPEDKDVSESAANDQTTSTDTARSTIPKLSEAALARRRKREAARQKDDSAVPPF